MVDWFSIYFFCIFFDKMAHCILSLLDCQNDSGVSLDSADPIGWQDGL